MDQDPANRLADRRTERGEAAPALVLDAELHASLAPWIDLAEVGAVGLRSWLLTVLPLLPRPRREPPALDKDVSAGKGEARIANLAQSLVECATARARDHFQASEYFQENRILAARVKALEGMLRLRAEAGGPGATAELSDPAADAAMRRYLPPSGD